jgi:hypothetical protein
VQHVRPPDDVLFQAVLEWWDLESREDAEGHLGQQAVDVLKTILESVQASPVGTAILVVEAVVFEEEMHVTATGGEGDDNSVQEFASGRVDSWYHSCNSWEQLAVDVDQAMMVFLLNAVSDDQDGVLESLKAEFPVRRHGDTSFRVGPDRLCFSRPDLIWIQLGSIL